MERLAGPEVSFGALAAHSLRNQPGPTCDQGMLTAPACATAGSALAGVASGTRTRAKAATMMLREPRPIFISAPSVGPKWRASRSVAAGGPVEARVAPVG